MTRAEWMFVIVWIINLIVSVLYYLWGALFYVPARQQQDKDEAEYLHDNRRTYLIRVIVMVLCPIVGPLFFLVSHLIYMKEEKEEQTDAETMLIDYMKRILCQKVFTEIEQAKFVQMMVDAAESLYQKNAQLVTPARYEAVCLRLIEQKQFDQADVWCERLAKQYPEELSAYTCRLKLYFIKGDKEHFFAVMDQLKKSDTIIDNETLELIRVFS